MRTELARVQARLGATTVYVTHDQTEAMTLGDRVAVMRDGVIQQVDTPARLYADPANLFVAGFIGSPAMNLVPARLDGDVIRLPFGDAPLPDGVRAKLERALGDHRWTMDVIAGVRPEHFEDAALDRDPGRLRFRANVDVVESMGSELYAHFALGAAPVVARLDASSRAQAGHELELALDTTHIHLFEGESGRSLTAGAPEA
jgi:multiple sugar transport system ATP-binding protein